MSGPYMLLPARDAGRMRLLQIPEDMEEHEAFRFVTGLIGEVQDASPDWEWEDILDTLENNGFSAVEFIIGPELD